MVTERPVPKPEEGQILVRVKAAGVNAMDTVLVSGAYKDYMEHRLPLIPGLDYAGTVEDVGPGVTGFAVGDEVFGAAGKSYAGEGTFAELVTASAALAVHRPESLSVEEAAAIPTAGGTALAEVDAAEVGAGDKVMIVGAAGGVGAFAVALATQRGASVIAVTNAANSASVRELGASEVVDYTAEDIYAQVERFAPDGLDALIDNFNDAAGIIPFAELVRAGGHVVSPRAMGADQTLADMDVKVHLVRAATDRIGELADIAARGQMKIALETYPLERTGDALARQATRQTPGKIVVLVNSEARK
jgi:NADPH:quinone reductase-like Zn-dependent oxidoreductase